MFQRSLLVILIVSMLFNVHVQMYRIHTSNDYSDESQRYQRGFGNRRSLTPRQRIYYPKEIFSPYANQDNIRADKNLFSNPYEMFE